MFTSSPPVHPHCGRLGGFPRQFDRQSSIFAKTFLNLEVQPFGLNNTDLQLSSKPCHDTFPTLKILWAKHWYGHPNFRPILKGSKTLPTLPSSTPPWKLKSFFWWPKTFPKIFFWVCQPKQLTQSFRWLAKQNFQWLAEQNTYVPLLQKKRIEKATTHIFWGKAPGGSSYIKLDFSLNITQPLYCFLCTLFLFTRGFVF